MAITSNIVTSTVIKAITLNSAYELHAERSIGSLEVGKFADLIVVDRNVATISPQLIESAQVLLTVVGGRAVFARGDQAVSGAARTP